MPDHGTLAIGIDCRYIHDRYDGIGRYTAHLLAGLCSAAGEHRIVAFVDAAHSPRGFPLDGNAPPGKLQIRPIGIPVYHPRGIWAWPAILRDCAIDIFHAPYHVWAPALLQCPLVSTVHDMIFDRYPRYMPQGYQWPVYKMVSALAVRRSRRVIADSQATKRDIVRFTRADARKIAVIPLGVDAHFRPVLDERRRQEVREQYGLPAAYMLALGARRPHKNTRRLMAGFASIAGDLPHALVVVGAISAGSDAPAHGALAALKGQRRVIELDYVPEADLPALYSMADLFVQPSIIEGFGLPVIEAMACGCPVACSNTSSLPEVAGDAALLFDPFSTRDLAAALRRVLSSVDLRRELSLRGLRRAGMFTWERATAETLSVYRS